MDNKALQECGSADVVLRRNDTTGEIAYYRTFAPRLVPLLTLVKVAGQRRRVEECFQTNKGPHRPGSAPGPVLDVLAPVDHPWQCLRTPS